MAKDARDRYQTMDELDQALQPFDVEAIAMTSPISQSIIPTIVSKPADPNAKTMMASAAIAGAAKLSRPTIVLTGLGLVVWMVAGVIDAAGGVLRQFKKDGDLTLAEALLLIIGSSLIALTPAIYFFVERPQEVVEQQRARPRARGRPAPDVLRERALVRTFRARPARDDERDFEAISHALERRVGRPRVRRELRGRLDHLGLFVARPFGPKTPRYQKVTSAHLRSSRSAFNNQ